MVAAFGKRRCIKQSFFFFYRNVRVTCVTWLWLLSVLAPCAGSPVEGRRKDKDNDGYSLKNVVAANSPTPQPTSQSIDLAGLVTFGVGISVLVVMLLVLMVLGYRYKADQAEETRAVRQERGAQRLVRSSLESANLEKLRNSIPAILFRNLNVQMRFSPSAGAAAAATSSLPTHGGEVELTKGVSSEGRRPAAATDDEGAEVVETSPENQTTSRDGCGKYFSNKRLKDQDVEIQTEHEDEGGAGGDGKMMCAICLEDFVGNDSCKQLQPCRHVFHASCFDTWLEHSVLCPLCKEPSVPTTGGTRF